MPKKGFTLLEVVIALVIILVGIVGAQQLINRSLKSQLTAAEKQLAANLAASELALLQVGDLDGGFDAWLERNAVRNLTDSERVYALADGWFAAVNALSANQDIYRVTFVVQMLDGRREIFVTYVARK